MTFSFFPKHFRPVRSGFPCSNNKTDIILVGFHKRVFMNVTKFWKLDALKLYSILLYFLFYPSQRRKFIVKWGVHEKKSILNHSEVPEFFNFDRFGKQNDFPNFEPFRSTGRF